MLPVIRGTGRDLARDRNIHPHGRNGWRTQLPGFFLTGGPCGSPSFFLSFMLSIFFDPSSLSDFRFLRLPLACFLSHSLSLRRSSSSSLSVWPTGFRLFYLIGAAPIRTPFLFRRLFLSFPSYLLHRVHRRAPLLLATFALFLPLSLPLSLASAGNSER